jgi:hypothetical protein
VAGHRLLIPLPLAVVALVALRGREAAEVQPLEDPPDPGLADVHVVVALEVHGDLARAEVVVRPQVDDLGDHFGWGFVRAVRGPLGPVPQPGEAFGFVAAVPDVEDLAADPVVPAGQRHVPGDLAGVADDRQAAGSVAVEFLVCHKSLR